MAQKKNTREQLQAAVDAYAAHGGTATLAADVLGIPRSTLLHRLRVAKQEGIESTISPTVAREESLRKQVKALTAQLRAAEDEKLTNAYVRQKIFGLSAEAPSPPRWLISPKIGKGAPGVPCLMWSDWHWGEVVDKNELNGTNEFNLKIAHARAKNLVETCISLLKSYTVNPNYPGVVLNLGGDMVTGDIHDELSQTNDAPIMPTLVDLFGVLVTCIERLADEFGNVFVPCVAGNHGRNTRKPRHKQRAFTNFDWLLYQLLDKHFQGDRRVTFFIPDGADAMYKVHNHCYLLTHGDQFRGGDGVIGPLGPLCVAPDTPVLMSDLTYRAAGDLKIGDSLVGFDESVPPRHRRRFRKAVVTEMLEIELECIEIETSDGVKTVASEGHPWLVRSGASHAWCLTSNLHLGSRIMSLGRPQERTDSWDAGYLAGVIDGEGSIEKKGRMKFTQQDNACLAEASRILTDFGVPSKVRAKGAGKRGHEECFDVVLNPGKENSGVEHLKLLAQLRPPKTMQERGERLWVGRGVQIAEDVTVVGLRRVGLRKTAAFTTSTSTFVANGMLTHNTRGNIKKMSRNSQMGLDYDTMVVGHFHTLMMLPRLIVNGSLKGYDEYAFAGNFPFEPPAQALWLTHPEYGITISMPVFCERGGKKGKTDWVSITK